MNQFLRSRNCLLGLLATGCVLIGCTPKIIVMDRQTILEQESAGDWPQMEKLLTENASVQGPIPFPKTAVTAKKERLYNVLNGEMEKQQ